MAASLLDDEDVGGVAKVATGRWSEINKTDVVDVAETIVNFIPGVGAATAGTGLSAVGATWRAKSKREKLEIALGLRDLEGCVSQSCGIQEGVDNINSKRNHTIAGGVVAGGGGLAGMAIGSAIFPGVGSIAGFFIGAAGSVIGGMAASKAYDAIMVDKTEETLELVAKIRLAQMQAIEESQKTGQPVNAGVPEEVVFAAMIVNLPKERREEVARLAGVENFSELVANGDLKKLRALMDNPSIDNILRADSGIFFFSPEDPTQSVAAQVTARINRGEIDANEILFNQQRRLELSVMAAGAGLHNNGVSPTAAGAIQELPPAGGSLTRA